MICQNAEVRHFAISTERCFIDKTTMQPRLHYVGSYTPFRCLTKYFRHTSTLPPLQQNFFLVKLFRNSGKVEGWLSSKNWNYGFRLKFQVDIMISIIFKSINCLDFVCFQFRSAQIEFEMALIKYYLEQKCQYIICMLEW